MPGGHPEEDLEVQVFTRRRMKYYLTCSLIGSNTSGFTGLFISCLLPEQRAEASRSQRRLATHAGGMLCRLQTKDEKIDFRNDSLYNISGGGINAKHH